MFNNADARLSRQLSDMSIVIVSHVAMHGPAQELEKHLAKRVKRLLFIGHPFDYAKDTRSFFKEYKDGVLTKTRYFPKLWAPNILIYIKDVLLTICWVGSTRRFNLFIGADNLNARAGLILRSLGRVRKVVFYTIDYVPKRFKNGALNGLYHWNDKSCVRNCDVTWNLSENMAKARQESGLQEKYYKNQITVPVGTNLDTDPLPLAQANRYEVVFMGHLREGQGTRFLIEVFSDILPELPGASLLIMGGGYLEEELKELARRMNIIDRVRFTGFVEDIKDIEERLVHCALAAAPYEDSDKSFTRYADPGKPKAYLAAGLPVVITRVPAIAEEIERRQCGMVVNFDRREFGEAIVRLLQDERLLVKYRRNAREFAEEFAWPSVFENAFSKSFSIFMERGID